MTEVLPVMQSITRKIGREFCRALLLAILAVMPLVADTAAADTTWTQTSQADFASGTLFQLDIASSPGDVKLAKASSGYVYAFKGYCTKTFWRYEIATDNWSALANAPRNVYAGGALAYDGSNYIYALAGGGKNYFWRYNIATNTWETLTNALQYINAGGALVYDGGNYLYALAGGGKNKFMRYSISSDTWSNKATTPAAVYGGGALTYGGGDFIYALGGMSTNFWKYSIPGNNWTVLTGTPSCVGDGGALATDGSNYVYALKGANTATFWRYDISLNSWSSLADTPVTPCIWGGGALVYDKDAHLYALRGNNQDDFWKYDIASNAWSIKHDTPSNVAYGGALAFKGASYYTSGNLISSTYDAGYAADFGNISWTATAPAATSVKFQIATNSDNATWVFKGPNGSGGTYYTSSDTAIWAGHDGDRYIKYKAFLDTTDTSVTPVLHDISISFTQIIVLPSAATADATLVEETTATLHGAVTDDGGEACQYRFEYGTVSGNYTLDTGWSGNLTTGQAFSFNVTGLGKGTKYYFRAQVKNSAGTGSGDEFNFLTKPDPPVETTFIATAISDTQINLTWTKGEGALNTVIRRKTGDYPADRNDGDPVYFDTGTSCADTGLTPETQYCYRAWSQVTGSEQWSDGYRDATATTASSPPPTTTLPVAVGGTVYPVNKAQVLMPWLVGLSVFTLVTGGIFIRIVRMKKRV
jgi:outer membrane protein assembly factor BamB